MATDIDWPSEFPKPRTDYKRTLRRATLRTPFESGYVQTRAQWTRDTYVWSFTLDLRGADIIAAFETFFSTTVQAGAESFNWIDPDYDGLGTTSYEVRFQQDEIVLEYIHANHARVAVVFEEA